jgi:nucleoside-diphosphate-sugar epimerase
VNATADALGMPRPTRHVPAGLAFGAAWAADVFARLPGREPPFTRAMIDLMTTDQVVDSSRLRADLGWEHRTRFAEGMWRMQEWYRSSQSKKEDSGVPETCGGGVRQSA